MKNFPKDFFWGAATASYQVEGGIENNDWAAAARAGRVPVCGIACDHYHRYEEDFDLAVELGHNAHRFSIEWARIEPAEGQFDLDAIAHYRRVIAALKARQLEPIMTLWHFTLPLWFAESGGFERKDAPQIFARYAKFVTEQLGSEVHMITTINEPVVFAGLGWLKGNWPPFKMFSLVELNELTHSGNRDAARPHKSLFAYFTYRRVINNLARAHCAAYRTIKTVNPAINVSLVKHVVAFDANRNILNRLRAYVEDRFLNHSFLRKVYKHTDAFGLNFYHYVKFGDRPYFEQSDMGWEMAPHGIYNALQVLWKYKKPIFISECGVADADDSHRAWYIEEQIKGVEKALLAGIDVRGHLFWSLLDNYEWALGFEKQFGLIKVHYDDNLRREIRPSAWRYKELIAEYSTAE